MEFHNLTPFPALAYEGIDQLDQEFHVIAMRATFGIIPDSELQPADDQQALAVADEYFGEMNKSSVKQESDLAQYKPKCDVIVVGSAHAPEAKPAARFEACIRISGSVSLEKKLTIHGPRFWEKSNTGWILTEPAPLTSLPLQYEYAFGGECRINKDDPAAQRVKPEFHLTPEQLQQHPDGAEKAPVAHTAYELNPVGIGYTEQWYLEATQAEHISAPQIESPDDPIREFGKQYEPQGFGVITKAWLPRRQLAGTADDAFAQSEKWLPEDFDFAFWNGAHPDLQIPWLKGGECIELMNLFPVNTKGMKADKDGNQIVRIIIPEAKPYLFVKLEDGGIVPADLKIDTVLIDTEDNTVSLTYRTVLWKELGIEAISAKVINKKDRVIIDGWLNQSTAPAGSEVQHG